MSDSLDSASTKISLIAVGDVFLNTPKGDFNPFTHVLGEFKGADLVFCNLETVLTNEQVPALQKSVSLRTDELNVKWLREANIEIVNLAHNHICDYGKAGFDHTLSILDGQDIQYIGVGHSKEQAARPVIIRQGNIQIGFLGFYGPDTEKVPDCHIAPIDEDVILHQIAGLRNVVDFIVVSLHWGVENTFYPSPAQQRLARNLIDHGVSIILGHHPHVIQGIERYQDGLILYSLGNFNFHQFTERHGIYHSLSYLAYFELRSDYKVDFECIPVMIDEDWCPRILKDRNDVQLFHDHIQAISKVIDNRLTNMEWMGKIALPYLIGNGRSYIIRIKRYGIKHLLLFMRWLVSPHNIRLYIALILRLLRGEFKWDLGGLK